MQSQKDTVRRLALLARSRVGDTGRAAEDAAVLALELPEVSGASAVLAFASFGAEIGTDPLLAGLFSMGKEVLLPYVDGDVLGVAAISSLDDLAPGYRGIREPARREPASEVEVAIVPGVAFDERGGRLGHGGGFYDRFLAVLDPAVPVIGFCFDAQVVEAVPREPHDRPVNIVVTERRVIRCA